MEAETVQNPNHFDDQTLIQRCKNKPQELSLNQIYQENMPSQCGYCHKKDTSYSWSFTKKKMDSYTYELLIERGWRRCGTYYYKPNLNKSCCKLFTHRMEANRFKPKRDQKKAVKRVIMIAYDRVESMLAEQSPTNKDKHKNKNNKGSEKAQAAELPPETKQQLQKVCQTIVTYMQTNIGSLIKGTAVNEQLIKNMKFDTDNKVKYFKSRSEDNSDYYSNLIMLIFGLNKKIIGDCKYTLLQFAKDVKEGVEGLNPIHGFKVEVERGGYLFFRRVPKDHTNQYEILGDHEKKSSEMEVQEPPKKQENNNGFSKIFKSIKSQFKKTQKVPQDKNLQQLQLQDKHSSKFQVLRPEHQYKGQINISHNKITFGKLTIEVVKAEQNVQSFKLYQDYCSKIHQKPQKNMSSYVNFLCLQALDFRVQDSKIPNEQKGEYIPSWDPECKHQKPKKVTGQVKKLLGCYHMKYYFKGSLIGVGVIDMVDDGLSSVYFFYDPKYKEYRLGVFSSIIQIQYVRWMRLSFPEFRYYYMGFYISDSQKMNYKVDYAPCELMCPVTYQFVQLTQQVKQMVEKIVKGQQKDIRLTPKDAKMIEDMHFGRDMGPYIDKTLKLMYNGRRLVLRQINPQFFVHILKILNVNVRVWGKKLFDIFTFSL